MMNGPPPTSQGGQQFGENQVPPPFNEQDGNGQSGGPPTNQLPSLLQVLIYNIYIVFNIYIFILLL